MPRRRPFDPGIPPEILPPDFAVRHDLHNYLYFRPTFGLTPAQPWAPLTDAEWEALRPFLAEHGCGVSDHPRAGRPMVDARARLDAIFRAVTLKAPLPRGGRGTWAQLPAEHGKADTVSRCYRRWARANLWARLLTAVAHPECPKVLGSLTYYICCAFRRAVRLMGLRAIVLARRLRLFSALPAPSVLLPDHDLSESLWPVFPAIVNRMQEGGWRPDPRAIKGLIALHTLAAGRRRVSRWMEPA